MRRSGLISLLIILVIALVTGSSLTSCGPAEEEPPGSALVSPYWSPSTIPTNTPTPITIYVAFIDPNYVPIPESVTLWRDSTSLGMLHDDGTGGDPVAGDLIYTIMPIFSESAQTAITLMVSVQFTSVAEEVFSDSFSIKVSEEAIICTESETVTLGKDGSFKLPDLTGATPDIPSAILLNQGIFPSGAEVTQDPPPGTVFTELGIVDITFTAVHSETVAQCIMTLSIVDTIPPEITVEGIESGDVFDHCVSPTISVSDNLDPPETIELQALLNGEDYILGTPICEPGEYTLSVVATDSSGNSAESQTIFGIADTSKTKGAAMVVKSLDFQQTAEGVSMSALVLLASNQFDTFKIDGYSAMLHVFDCQGQVLDEQPIRVAGSIGHEGLYSPLTAQAWFQWGFWALTFEAELQDYPCLFLMTGSAFEGEVDWVAGALLEPPDPVPPVVTLAPLNVPLAPSETDGDAIGMLEDAGLIYWKDSREQDGFIGSNETCPKCEWKYIDRLGGKNSIARFPPNTCWGGITQTGMDILAEDGYIKGWASAIDTCLFMLADDAASVISKRTIKVWLEGAPPECCGCQITLEANPAFKAESNLDPPGLAQAGGRIEVRGDLSATAAGAVVSGTSTESVSFSAGPVGFTVPAVSVTEGKKSEIFSGSDATILNKCAAIVTVTGTGFLKTMADANLLDWVAVATATLKESRLEIKIEAKCTAPIPECAPKPFTYELP